MTEQSGQGPEHPEYTEFHRASTPMEASLICNLLRSSGIRANVEGGLLADEFAVSQRLMNAQEVRVYVPADQLDEAREVLEAARLTASEVEEQAMAAAPAPEAEREVEAAPQSTSQRSLLAPTLAIVFAILTVVFAALWQRSLRDIEGEDPLWVAEFELDGIRWRWRASGLDAFRQFDRNTNGLFEESRAFDRDGRLMSIHIDADEDAIFEKTRELRADGTEWEWSDENGDGGWDRCEIRDADGALLQTFRYAGVDGVTGVR